MSLASEITRITNLRNTIRTKLVNLGIITNSSATLSDCSTAINGLSKVIPSTPATTITVSPTMSVNTSTGVVTASGSNTASVKPTSSKGYTDGSSTAGTITAKVSKTLQLTTQAAQTITPGTSNKTIAAGRWLTGAQTIKGDSNLIAANIKSGKSIFGVAGSATSVEELTGTITESELATKTVMVGVNSSTGAASSTTSALCATIPLNDVHPSAVSIYNPAMVTASSPTAPDSMTLKYATYASKNFLRIRYYKGSYWAWISADAENLIVPMGPTTMSVTASRAHTYQIFGG